MCQVRLLGEVRADVTSNHWKDLQVPRGYWRRFGEPTEVLDLRIGPTQIGIVSLVCSRDFGLNALTNVCVAT